ncbi:MAG TPA: pitrilysin family protein [Vicinamibacterales bacterium]
MIRADRSRLPAIGPVPDIRFPRIVKHTRADGLRVWTVEHREVPVVCFNVLFPAGSAADPASRHGLAALTADLLDEGTEELDALGLHDALARIGSQLDIDVGPDATTVGLVTLTKFARRGLEVLADVANRPRFDERDFQRVRDHRVSRLAQLRDVPGAVAERLFALRLYGEHPYGHTPLGSEAALAAISLDDARRFHAEVLLASEPTLIVVGDISHDEVVRFADELWPVRGGGTNSVPPTPEPASAGPSTISLVHRAGAAQSELRIGRVAAARATPDYARLAVLNTALGGAFVSRINLRLREEKGFTYGARSTFDYRRRRGPFVVQTSVQTDATAEAVDDILAEIGGITTDRPITPLELARAHAALTRGYARNFETADQVARAVAQIALHGLPDDYFDRFVSAVTQVTADEVTAVAREYLPLEDMQVVVVGDRDRVSAGLSGLGLGDPIEYAASLEPVGV